MSTGPLYISFWDICLDNLSDGIFQCCRILPDEASRYIQQARQENKLLCVCHVDLAAPYEKREAEDHEALCRVLTGHFGIPLSVEDFSPNTTMRKKGRPFTLRMRSAACRLVTTAVYL